MVKLELSETKKLSNDLRVVYRDEDYSFDTVPVVSGAIAIMLNYIQIGFDEDSMEATSVWDTVIKMNGGQGLYLFRQMFCWGNYV